MWIHKMWMGIYRVLHHKKEEHLYPYLFLLCSKELAEEVLSYNIYLLMSVYIAV